MCAAACASSIKAYLSLHMQHRRTREREHRGGAWWRLCEAAAGLQGTRERARSSVAPPLSLWTGRRLASSTSAARVAHQGQSGTQVQHLHAKRCTDTAACPATTPVCADRPGARTAGPGRVVRVVAAARGQADILKSQACSHAAARPPWQHCCQVSVRPLRVADTACLVPAACAQGPVGW